MARNLPSPTVNLQALSDLLRVLAEPKRLLILNTLMNGIQCNCELSDALGMAPNLVSHHMSVLCQSGLVTAERDPLDARWVYYTVNPAALASVNAQFGDFFDPARIQVRRTCGPSTTLLQLVDNRSSE